MSSSAIAITLSMFGTVCCSLAFVLQKKAHNLVKPGENPCTNVWWLIGMTSLIIGSTLHAVALGFGNQVLLSTLRSFTVLFNSIFTVTLLGEKLFISDILGIILIFTGSGFFLVCAKAGDEDQYSAVELHEIYMRPASLIYTSMSSLVVVGSMLTDHYIKNKIQSYYESAINTDNEQSD